MYEMYAFSKYKTWAVMVYTIRSTSHGEVDKDFCVNSLCKRNFKRRRLPLSRKWLRGTGKNYGSNTRTDALYRIPAERFRYTSKRYKPVQRKDNFWMCFNDSTHSRQRIIGNSLPGARMAWEEPWCIDKKKYLRPSLPVPGMCMVKDCSRILPNKSAVQGGKELQRWPTCRIW